MAELGIPAWDAGSVHREPVRPGQPAGLWGRHGLDLGCRWVDEVIELAGLGEGSRAPGALAGSPSAGPAPRRGRRAARPAADGGPGTSRSTAWNLTGAGVDPAAPQSLAAEGCTLLGAPAPDDEMAETADPSGRAGPRQLITEASVEDFDLLGHLRRRRP